MSVPKNKNWSNDLGDLMDRSGNTKDEMLKIIYAAQEMLDEMRPVKDFLGVQSAFITNVLSHYEVLFQTRFQENPPPSPTADGIEQLDSPGQRKVAVREVALAITRPGELVTDQGILEYLNREGKRINANNPMATISTILNGFKDQFEKIEGKRGVFRRKGVSDSVDVTV